VALSLISPSPVKPVGVTHHRILSCSDFPPASQRVTNERSPQPRHGEIIAGKVRINITHHSATPCPTYFAIRLDERRAAWPQRVAKSAKKNPRQHDTIFNVLIDPSREA